jgi:hypothetical protein|tara:strand:- start:612 stop:1274 length:663 start_codon:yes stop_codon:yes gene_type:complete
MKKSGFFWVSYADLMTSLFFVMLVLYVISFTILKSKQSELQAAADQLKKLEDIQLALEGLDENYFKFDRVNKRYKLQVSTQFNSNSDDIIDIPITLRKKLFNAGKVLYAKIDEVTKENPTVDYLLIIEGNTQRSNQNWIKDPDAGYELSYRRALSLFNYWKSRGLEFKDLGSQCEIIIAGSGHFGYSRDQDNERNNRKFSIQVTSKVGKLLSKSNNNEKQ